MALPSPKVGLVISYSYLWLHESGSGVVEGRKNRPCAIILDVRRENDMDLVTVVPITHTPPKDRTVAVEIPPRIKRHLGLDDDRSWVVLDEFNEFAWPGFDLRPNPAKPGQYDYGFLPPLFYDHIVRHALEIRRKGISSTIPRSDEEEQ